MWIFFTIAVAISLTTYMESAQYSFLDNILNTTDLALTAIVSVAIYFFGDHTSRFSRFDKGCLLAVTIILLFWLITKNHVVTHTLTQIILVIAYFPVISRLWKTRENGESFTIWIGMLLAPVLSLLSSKGTLATILFSQGHRLHRDIAAAHASGGVPETGTSNESNLKPR